MRRARRMRFQHFKVMMVAQHPPFLVRFHAVEIIGALFLVEFAIVEFPQLLVA